MRLFCRFAKALKSGNSYFVAGQLYALKRLIKDAQIECDQRLLDEKNYLAYVALFTHERLNKLLLEAQEQLSSETLLTTQQHLTRLAEIEASSEYLENLEKELE